MIEYEGSPVRVVRFQMSFNDVLRLSFQLWLMNAIIGGTVYAILRSLNVIS